VKPARCGSIYFTGELDIVPVNYSDF